MTIDTLYGLKLESESSHKHMEGNMRNILGFRVYLTHPYIWMKPADKASGFKYYEYISTLIDDGMTFQK